jgi:hypothetical protein
MKSLFILVCVLGVAQAKNATVLLAKGKVTKLLPGKHKAGKVKKGDKVPEDTSILTGKGSIVKVKMPDGSMVSLGPKSKLVVSLMKKNKPSMVGLLKGVIRAEVDKKQNNKNKMIIKTRTAAMGVRGTKLKTSYNPQTRTTSLVTIEGKVAMVKVQEKKIIKEAQEEAKEEAGNKASKKKIAEAVKEKELEKLTEALEDEDEAVEVKKGRFAGVNIKLEKATKPAKVAPKQMIAIATKDELAVEKVDAKKYEKELIEELEESNDEDPDFDKDDGTIKPKDGGLVDFDTGIYVAPTKEAKLNKKTGIYEDKKIGSIAKNGDYQPPKGVKLDAKKGFVVDKKSVKVADKSAAAATVALLNDEEVKGQIVTDQEIKAEIKQELAMVTKAEPVNQVSEEEEIEDDGTGWFSEKKWGYYAAPFAQNITITNAATGRDSTIVSSMAMRARMDYRMKWSTKKTTYTTLGLGLDAIQFSSSSRDIAYSTRDVVFPELSINTSWDSKELTTISADFLIKWVPYIDADQGSTVVYSNIFTPRLRGSYRTLMGENKKRGYFGTAALSLILPVENESEQGEKFDTNAGIGLDLSLDSEYKYNKKKFTVSAFLGYEWQEIAVNEYQRLLLVSELIQNFR